jgi:hypothetical protein
MGHASPATLPPVRVNTAATSAADEAPVRLVPGYGGFVARSREAFGRTFGATTEALPTGHRRSLFKLTRQLAQPDRVPLPNEHPQAVLQKTSWTAGATHDGQPPVPLFSEADMYLTTNHVMQSKTDTTGTPEDDIRMVPGYTGHIHTRRETFGATWGSTVRPLRDRPAPSTKTTLLTPRGHEGPMRSSKGLQVHSQFTVPITPRERTSIARAVQAAQHNSARAPISQETRARVLELTSRAGIDGAELDDNGAVVGRRPTAPPGSGAGTPRRPQRPVYTRPSTTGVSFAATSHRDRLSTAPAGSSASAAAAAAAAAAAQPLTAKVDASAFKPPLVGKKPRNSKVVNSLFNVGRGGYMGQDAEKAASSFHVKNRPFGSQFKVHQPTKTTPYGHRYERM